LERTPLLLREVHPMRRAWSILLCFCSLEGLTFGDESQRKHALIVVVDNLGSLQLPDALDNASELRKTFVSLPGFGESRVKRLGNPKRDAAEAAVRDLAAGAKPGEAIYLYYLGHGFKSGGKAYWATADTPASGGSPSGTGGSVSTDDLLAWLQGTKAKDIVLFNDACRNLAAGGQSSSADGWNGLGERLSATSSGERRRVLIVHATKDNEQGLSHPDAGGSLLSRFFVEACKGEATKVKDPTVEGSELRTVLLQAYIARRYGQFQAKFKRPIQPVFEASNVPGDGLYLLGVPMAQAEFTRAGDYDAKRFWETLNKLYDANQTDFISIRGEPMDKVNQAFSGRRGGIAQERFFETRLKVPNVETVWLEGHGSNRFRMYAVFAMFDSPQKAYEEAKRFMAKVGLKDDDQKIPVEPANEIVKGIDLLKEIGKILDPSSNRGGSSRDEVPFWKFDKGSGNHIGTITRYDRSGRTKGMTLSISIVSPPEQYLVITDRIANPYEQHAFGNKTVLMIHID
jgi:hypothetical protein